MRTRDNMMTSELRNKCPQNRNLITNFEPEEIYAYEQAIKQFGCDRLYIADDAYDINGNKLNGCFALRYSGERPKDLSGFFDIFRSIRNKFAFDQEWIDEHRRHLKALRLMHELMDILDNCSDTYFASTVRFSVYHKIRRLDLQEREDKNVSWYEDKELNQILKNMELAENIRGKHQ